MVEPAPQNDVGARPAGIVSTGVGWDRWDTAFALVLAALTILAHPVGLILDRPYWLDESWVAVLTRISWLHALSSSSSTPVGWLALARMVPGSSLQRARLLTLGFSMGSTAAAYGFARALSWPSKRSARVAAVAVAVAVACVPIALVRNDLKQYTGDAFFALGLLAVTRWVDRNDRPRAAIWLGVAALVAYPFSTSSAFVSVACFGGVFASALIARNRARIIATAAVGAVLAAGLLSVYLIAVAPHVNQALRNYWQHDYLTGGTINELQQTWHRLQEIEHGLAMPAAVAIALFVLGIVVLARMRQTALAFAIAVLWIEMFVAGAVSIYPFLDQRTFHFVLIPSVAVVAVGVVGAVYEIARRMTVGGIVIAVIVAVLFWVGVAPDWRQLGIPHEDTRSQTLYVAKKMGPRDVIVVSSEANWAFAFYWPHGSVHTVHSDLYATGFKAQVANIDVVYAGDRTEAAVLAAMVEAVDRQQRLGPASHILIVRSHVAASEQSAWQHAFAVLHLEPRSIRVGPEALLIVDPPSAPTHPAGA